VERTSRFFLMSAISNYNSDRPAVPEAEPPLSD